MSIFILRTTYDYLLNEQQKCKDSNEQGGIFIGRYKGPHIEILDLTKPGRFDTSLLYRFIRKDKIHQKKALAAWRESEHTQTYVGEWHTHPSGGPIPSQIDLNTWKNVIIINRSEAVFSIISPNAIAFYLGYNESHMRYNNSSIKFKKITPEIL